MNSTSRSSSNWVMSTDMLIPRTLVFPFVREWKKKRNNIAIYVYTRTAEEAAKEKLKIHRKKYHKVYWIFARKYGFINKKGLTFKTDEDISIKHEKSQGNIMIYTGDLPEHIVSEINTYRSKNSIGQSSHQRHTKGSNKVHKTHKTSTPGGSTSTTSSTRTTMSKTGQLLTSADNH